VSNQFLITQHEVILEALRYTFAKTHKLVLPPTPIEGTSQSVIQAFPQKSSTKEDVPNDLEKKVSE